MRKLLISAALATATIATAVPATAMAQPGYGWQRGGPTRVQVVNLLRDLNQAEAQISRNRRISAREAIGLRREAQQIRLRLNLAQRNGINQREFNDLRSRVTRLQIRVRMEARDFDNRRH
jgi:hypothetical protein